MSNLNTKVQNKVDIEDINLKAIIAFALLSIAFLLVYIAFLKQIFGDFYRRKLPVCESCLQRPEFFSRQDLQLMKWRLPWQYRF